MRVLCVFSTLDRGGAESMCMELYRHIDRSKIQFDFVKHTTKIGAFEKEIISLGGRIYEAPRLKFGQILKYIKWWITHLDTHSEHQIIHGHFFTISAVYFLVAKRLGRTTVGHIHISKPNSIGKAVLGKLISSVTDYPLACSKIAGEWVYGSRPFTVLNNAIDATRFKADARIALEVRKEFDLTDSFVLGNVSRFNKQKNPFGILEIFRLVHQRRPESKLIWVGDGPLRRDVFTKAEELGICSDILFLGVRDDVERVMQAMDVFIFPSFYEGLGIAAVEAQAAGIRTFCSEAVPQEAAVTSLCQFLPLGNLQLWENEICAVPAGYEHPVMIEQIIKAGYDIYDTTKWIQEFYLSIGENHK